MYPAANQYSTALASHSCTAVYKSSLIKKNKNRTLDQRKIWINKIREVMQR